MTWQTIADAPPWSSRAGMMTVTVRGTACGKTTELAHVSACITGLQHIDCTDLEDLSGLLVKMCLAVDCSTAAMLL